MKVTLRLLDKMAAGLVMALTLSFSLAAWSGDAPAPSTGQTQPAHTPADDPLITDEEINDLLSKLVAPSFTTLEDISAELLKMVDEVRPGMTDDEFADLLKKARGEPRGRAQGRQKMVELKIPELRHLRQKLRRLMKEHPDIPTNPDQMGDLSEEGRLIVDVEVLQEEVRKEDTRTAGVPKPTPSEETQKVEEKKPGFWESLIPALIPSIGIGGGRERRERRQPSNPCSGR